MEEIRVLLDNRAEKDLKKVPSNVKTRFFKTLEQLKQEPLIGIPLTGGFKTYRKIRLGDYRIVYKYYPKDKIIIISRIRSRQSVYKN